ncbi:hypothetical protein, partial [Tropheryma whipplei]|uniref:hypothetical protein n=1 Tax=Tropheryma whipplei TaxID=2039 RepID=UPI0005AA4DC0
PINRPDNPVIITNHHGRWVFVSVDLLSGCCDGGAAGAGADGATGLVSAEGVWVEDECVAAAGDCTDGVA